MLDANDNTNSQCISNLQAEIHVLKNENVVLFEKIQRMEKNWDNLIKQTSVIESSRSKLEWEIKKARSELQTKNNLLHHLDTQNTDLQVAMRVAGEENKKLNEQLQQKLNELEEFQNEAKVASEKHNHSMKLWKEEKRTMVKQREETARKLDACEDELQAYFNENAKLEKQLRQVRKKIQANVPVVRA